MLLVQVQPGLPFVVKLKMSTKEVVEAEPLDSLEGVPDFSTVSGTPEYRDYRLLSAHCQQEQGTVQTWNVENTAGMGI